MCDDHPFTVSTFYNFINKKRLMAAKCSKCGTMMLPPKPMCTKCFSTDLNWIELEGTGRLLSYTVIHIAQEQFQFMVPYSVGIVEFNSGLRLPGMICDVTLEELKVGMNLKICFDTSTSKIWPPWSKYFFRSL